MKTSRHYMIWCQFLCTIYEAGQQPRVFKLQVWMISNYTLAGRLSMGFPGNFLLNLLQNFNFQLRSFVYFLMDFHGRWTVKTIILFHISSDRIFYIRRRHQVNLFVFCSLSFIFDCHGRTLFGKQCGGNVTIPNNLSEPLRKRHSKRRLFLNYKYVQCSELKIVVIWRLRY